MKSTSGKQLCSRLSGDDFWVVLVESVEDCLDRCKKHDHCQKANYYNYDKSPPNQGRCMMYPIGAEQCNGDDHEQRTPDNLFYPNYGEPDQSIECIPKRCRHGKNKHDCLKDAGPEGAFCHHSFKVSDDVGRIVFDQNQMRCTSCKNSWNNKLGFRFNF